MHHVIPAVLDDLVAALDDATRDEKGLTGAPALLARVILEAQAASDRGTVLKFLADGIDAHSPYTPLTRTLLAFALGSLTPGDSPRDDGPLNVDWIMSNPAREKAYLSGARIRMDGVHGRSGFRWGPTTLAHAIRGAFVGHETIDAAKPLVMAIRKERGQVKPGEYRVGASTPEALDATFWNNREGGTRALPDSILQALRAQLVESPVLDTGTRAWIAANVFGGEYRSKEEAHLAVDWLRIERNPRIRRSLLTASLPPSGPPFEDRLAELAIEGGEDTPAALRVLLGFNRKRAWALAESTYARWRPPVRSQVARTLLQADPRKAWTEFGDSWEVEADASVIQSILEEVARNGFPKNAADQVPLLRFGQAHGDLIAASMHVEDTKGQAARAWEHFLGR